MIDVTIVICTHNRADALPNCLASISKVITQCTAAKVEVVIVDNGSTDNTRDVVSAWLRSVPFQVQFVEERRPGLGAARNTGVRNARGRLIAFTDDDCQLAPEYLSDMLRHFGDDKSPVIRGGRVELGDATDFPLGIKVCDSEVIFKYPMHPGLIALGCNMVIHREVFARVGLFDERFGAGTPFKASEETEFFYRAYLCKVPVIYVPDMVVYHFHGRKTRDVARAHYWGYSIGTGAMYAKHMFARGGLQKHLYWDLRKAVREVVSDGGAEKGFENGLFSRPFMMLQVLKGMGLFWVTAGVGRFRNVGRRSMKEHSGVPRRVL